MDKLNVRDADVAGKRVLLRVDFNVPLEDGKVTDDSRVRASIPTIHYLLTHGARVILASHLGRPDGKVLDGLRLRPVAERLSQILGRNVPVTGDALGIGTVDAVKRLRNGELLMLENLRFHAEEEKNDPAFSAQLAEYAELFVNDAFGAAHRAHASTVGVAQLLPAYAGFLLEREITMLQRLRDNPAHPFATVIGGAKISGKLKVLDSLMAKVDVLVVGGGMANTFLLAQGKAVGKSLAEHDMVDEARRVLAAAEKAKVQVILPVDVVVAKEVTRGTEYKTIPAEKIPASWHVVDVGRATLDLMEDALASAKTVFWNGPLGVFEIPSFAHGTRAIARYLATRAEAGATVVVGGGDSVAAIQQQGLAERFTHISTGGGASLEFLEGRELPGVAVLLDRPPPAKKPRVRPSRAKAASAKATTPAKATATKVIATKATATKAAAAKATATKVPATRAAATKVPATRAATPAKANATKVIATKATAAKTTATKATAAKTTATKATAAKATAPRGTASKALGTAAKATATKATATKATATKATATKAAG